MERVIERNITYLQWRGAQGKQMRVLKQVV